MDICKVFVLLLLYVGSLRCEERNWRTVSRSSNTRRNAQMNKTFDQFAKLIEQGESCVEFTDDKVTLVLGNIYSGKTTLTKYLTENNANLQSVRNRLGSFIIKDNDDKISSYPNKFKTIFPELYYDVDTNDAYYDFPGSNPDDAVTEIAEAYFIQQIMENSRKFKIILTVDYEDVKDIARTENTILLLESIIGFVPDIQHYKDSIALVVTKVECDDDDNAVIRSVVNFLESIKNETENYILDINRDEDKMIQVLNILTYQSNINTGLYDKIALFRRPDKIGTLDTIDSLQDKKNKLYVLIDSLKYADKIEESRFTLKLSDEAYDTIESLVSKARQMIKTNMESVFDEINNYNNLLLEGTSDISYAIDKVIIPNLNSLKTCINFDTFSLRNMLNCVSQYQGGIYDISNHFFDTAISLKHVKILQDVYGAVIDDETNTIDYFLTKMDLAITENLIDYITWTEIYKSILEFLDIYENQLNRQNLIDDVIFTTKDNDELISRLSQEYNISHNLGIRRRVEESKQKVLQKILRSAADYEITYTCLSNGRLIISGNYIVTSQLDIDSKCPGDITHVNILGLYKVFLDDFPESLQTRDLGIVAPKLEQIDFSILRYGPSHRSKGFWVLSNVNLLGTQSNDYLYRKPCPVQMKQCYAHGIAPAINRFKMYTVLNDTIKKKEGMEYFKVLNKPWTAHNVYDTSGFIDELIQLEDTIHLSTSKTDFLPVYIALLERVENYAKEPLADETGSDYTRALKYVYTATLTKICNIKNNLDNDLIINIHEYLKLAIDDMNSYKDESTAEATRKLITRYKDNYNKDIDGKIDEAVYLMENYLSKVIEDLLRETDTHFENLLKEIAELQEDIEADIEYTKQKKSELEDIVRRKKVLAVISTIGKMFSFFGFFGSLFSMALDAGINTANAFLPQDINFDRKLTQLPAGVQEMLGKTSLALEKVEDERVKSLEDKLYVSLHYLARNPYAAPNSLTKFREIQIELRSIKYRKSSLEKIDTLNTEFDSELASMKQNTQRRRRRLSVGGVIDKIEKGIDIVHYSKRVFDECKDDEEKLHQLSEMIRESEQNLKTLDKYENKLNDLMKPTLDNMKSYVHDLQRDVSYQSEIGIIVSKWDMQNTLKDLKFELQKMTSGFQVQDDLSRTIEQLYDVLTTMMTVYERMQQYGDNRNLANLVTDIALASYDGLDSSTDSEILQSVNQLDNVIQKNVILNQYDRIINAFKQHVFPFADFFMEEFSLPALLVDDGTQYIIYDALNVLEKLQRKLVMSYATIDHRIDTYLHDATFHSNATSSKPFHVWKNSKYRTLISKLLAGEEIVVKADIMKSIHQKNAIKFSSIGLHLRAIKRSAQQELDDVLRNFGVRMTHMGNSYFRCDDKFYSILSQSQEISYSFEKNSKEEPLETNNVYKKIESGDLMLSPYAYWKLKLTERTDTSFDILRKFKNRIHLELVGHGYYVDMNSDVCNMNLGKYYNVANPIYDMVNIISNSNVNV